jgi:hypothetical protein
MNITEINKAMKLAVKHVLEEFKNQVQDSKYTEIDTRVTVTVGEPQIIDIEKDNEITDDSYVLNVNFQSRLNDKNERYYEVTATLVKEKSKVTGFRISEKAITFLNEFSRKVGKSKSAVVESLILQLKNNS